MPVITATLSFRMPELAVSLVSKGPNLDAAIDPHVLVAGVKDVRVDDQSVVDRQTRIANVPLGDGLEFKNKKLNVKGGAVKFVNVEPGAGTTGTMTPEDLANLTANPMSRVVYQSIIYYPATNATTGNKTYISAKTNLEYNQIVVNLETGAYALGTDLPPALVEHISDSVRHITATEREYWNNKVAVTVEPDHEIEGENYIVKFYK